MSTIGEYISRVRKPLKLDNADIRVTDRDIYSQGKKFANTLMKREDNKLKLMRIPSIMQTIHCVDLEEVDAVACCNIHTPCTIKRTVQPLAKLINGDWGPLIRAVKSLDGSKILQETTSESYQRKLNKSTFKYDKELYYWFENNYLYFPNIAWDAVIVEGVFEDEVYQDCKTPAPCRIKQEEEFRVPEYLMAEIENFVLQVFAPYVSSPTDTTVDKNENNK